MKKIIAISLIAATILSFAACSDNKDNKETIGTTEQVDPEKAPVSLTLDDINAVINSVKEDYAAATEMKLSDGTVISAAAKDPGITSDDVTNGTATKEQMNNFVVYIANIRAIVRDRLATEYTEGNHFRLEDETETVYDFIFLDPKADGFANAAEAISEMANADEEEGIKALTDYIYMEEKVIVFFEKETNEATMLCPTSEENSLLFDIQRKLDPGIVTKKAETAE